jgi:hypothetical protein
VPCRTHVEDLEVEPPVEGVVHPRQDAADDEHDDTDLRGSASVLHTQTSSLGFRYNQSCSTSTSNRGQQLYELHAPRRDTHIIPSMRRIAHRPGMALDRMEPATKPETPHRRNQIHCQRDLVVQGRRDRGRVVRVCGAGEPVEE